MSFILDALKKSENARQRQAGPALFEVKVTPPRRVLPLWALVIGLLLLIGCVTLSWILLRQRTAAPEAPQRQIAPAVVHAVPTSTIGTAVRSRRAPSRIAASPAPAIPTPAAASPVTAPTSVPAAQPTSPPITQPAPGVQVERAAAAAPNPAEFAPALPPAGGANSAPALPLYAQIAAAPGSDLPKLHLDLQVYAANPRKRFVMINMQKLRQGDSLADGVSVVRIRPDGVVLSFQGRKFLLPR